MDDAQGAGTRVVEAVTAQQVEVVRALMQGFLAWQRQRPVGEQGRIDAYFDQGAWDAELSGLPGKYAPPAGRLLLATVDEEPAGCVALGPLDGGRCEMKRMFVRPQRQGRGVGLALAQAVVAAAQDAGYSSMWLDTSVRQTSALSLYRRLGFEEVPPYYEVPEDLAEWLVFMRLEL